MILVGTIDRKEQHMKIVRMACAVLLVLLLGASVSLAKDFDWMQDLNVRAQADPSGFRGELAARFRIGDTQITAVLGTVDRPADAYMVFRLGEMSHHPADYVMQRYKTGKGKGWGVLAKSLGIKPGSKEFHALKRGHDLYDDEGKGKKGKKKHKDKDWK
jgi:hypothetical protein